MSEYKWVHTWHVCCQIGLHTLQHPHLIRKKLTFSLLYSILVNSQTTLSHFSNSCLQVRSVYYTCTHTSKQKSDTNYQLWNKNCLTTYQHSVWPFSVYTYSLSVFSSTLFEPLNLNVKQCGCLGWSSIRVISLTWNSSIFSLFITLFSRRLSW